MDKKWENMINDKNYSLLENVEMVKQKAIMLEKKAKQEEKYLGMNGGVGRHPVNGEKALNMLIDSIKAKISILDVISSDN